MNIYSDKLAHEQVVINCRYSIAQICTRKECMHAKLACLLSWRDESKWARNTLVLPFRVILINVPQYSCCRKIFAPQFFDACVMYMAFVMDIEKSFTSKKISFAQNQYSLLQPFCALHNFVCVFDEYSLKKKMCIALFL